VLGAFASAGEWREALGWKELIEAQGIKPNVTTYNMLVGVLEKCGRWEEAMGVYAKMPMRGVVEEPQRTAIIDESQNRAC
jgi:pentatricopeptide repeat protein